MHRIVITSDRYGSDSSNLAIERQIISEYPDFDAEVIGRASPDEDDLIASGRDADALLISTRDVITRRVVENLPTTKVISRYGVGMDNVDLDAAAEHGIVVTHYPAYCTAEVADHALALILALNRRIVELDRDVHDGAWVRHAALTNAIARGPIRPLRELTLGVIGFGRIGRAVIHRAGPFGLNLLVNDPYMEPAEIESFNARAVDLPQLMQRADIISVHCPLTPQTRGLIGAAELAMVKPGTVLVNTARGPIVDLSAAVDALRDGTLAAAAFDVVYPEPLPLKSELYRLPNVILTPHSAYYSERSVEVVRRETLVEAISVLQGRRPRTLANPAVLARVQLR